MSKLNHLLDLWEGSYEDALPKAYEGIELKRYLICSKIQEIIKKKLIPLILDKNGSF